MTFLQNRVISIKWLALTFLVFIISAGEGLGQTINFRNFTVSDGLSNSNVYHTLQDSRGFLWIATSSGVNRFDGKSFELFTTDNGLADNEVLRIFEDSKGRIWFLNFSGRLGFYYDGKFYNPENNETLKKAITKASFVTCFEDSAGRLWFATNQQKIVLIDDEKVKIYGKPHKLLDISSTFIFEDQLGRIIAANQKGFYNISHSTITEVPARFLPISMKSYQYNKRTKTLLFLAEEGLIQFSSRGFSIKRYLPEDLNKQEMGSFLIHKNNLWISSVTSGLYIIKPDGRTMTHYFANKIISDTMLDRDGNIWVTTFGDGLFILPAHTENLLHYTEATGLPENTVYSVIKDNVGKIWLGLKTGFITLIDGKKTSILNLNTSNAVFNPIKKLQYDKERNSVWFASNYALGEIDLDDPNKKIRYVKEKNNLYFSPKSFSFSKKGKLAFSLASGVYVLEDKSKSLIFETQRNSSTQRFFPDRAFKIFYDSKERLWFSNVNGLFRYHNNVTDTLSKQSPLLSQRVTDMLELPDGTFVIGTYGYGLIILDTNNKITRVTLKDGLTSNICRRLAYDGKYIWLTTFSGVDKFEYKASPLKITTYKVKNGLTSDEVQDIFIDESKIYLATNGGLTVLPRNEAAIKYSPPLFYITSFKSNGRQFKTDEVPKLEFNQNNISVNYTAINFSLSKESYQYRLNDDSPWVQTENNTIEFASLEPGNYQLSIRAKVQDSQWSNPANVSFVIDPAFWQRWWFLASMYALFTGLIIGLIYLYFKKQRQKEQDKLSIQTKIIALEQKALQAMMNPHFVFNIMNSIQYFINTKDSQAANQVLTGFARLIRKNLEICTKSYISLEEEFIYLKLYLSLEKLRFGDKMTYEFTVDEQIDTDETLIPSMLLQPFVENAIWHGIMPQPNGGKIQINVTQLNNVLTVQIADDGTGIDNSRRNKTSNHISRGMQITQERISLLNKRKKEEISIHSKQTGDFGTLVTVKIPV